MNRGVRYMVLSALGFSLMQLCVKFLSHIPFTELVLFRSLISAVLSLGLLWKLRISPLGSKRIYLVLRGVFGVTALSLFFFTLQQLPIATAITIQYLSPVFTTVFAVWILKEPMAAKRWIFFGVSFAGILVMKGFNPELKPLYLMAGIASAVFAGLAYNMIRKVKDSDHPVVVVFYFPLVATPIMAIFSLFWWVTPTGWDWLLILAMGVFTQIAQVYMTKAWQAETAGKIASLKYIGIGFALFFDWSLFGISPSYQTLTGIALVLIGVLLNLYAIREPKETTDPEPSRPAN